MFCSHLHGAVIDKRSNLHFQIISIISKRYSINSINTNALFILVIGFIELASIPKLLRAQQQLIQVIKKPKTTSKELNVCDL